MEFKDANIYFALRHEYAKVYDDYMYKEFIDFLDIGIKNRLTSDGTDMYEIIDEKKWFLAKIKYGI